MTTGDHPFPELVNHLRSHAIKHGMFTLKSERPSDWFIDVKQTTCTTEGLLLVAQAILSILDDDINAIGGLTMGADAVTFGTAGVAATRGRPLRTFSVRQEPKRHGTGGRIAGALRPGDLVAVIEDAASRGTSMLEAAHQIRLFGAHPVILIPIVDRGGTVADLAATENLPVRALVTAPDLGLPYDRDIR